jgi:hypothetical protein
VTGGGSIGGGSIEGAGGGIFSEKVTGMMGEEEGTDR